MEGLKYRGFWLRSVAFIIDVLLLLLLETAIFYLVEVTVGIIHVFKYLMTGLICIFLIFPFLLTILFWKLTGTSPGKFLVGAKIVAAETGKTPSIFKLAIRYWGYFVSLNPLFLGFIWSSWDSRKQACHDKLSGSIVVCRRSLKDGFSSQPSQKDVSRFRFVKYAFFICFLLFIGTFSYSLYLITHDEPLSPEAVEWMYTEKAEKEPQSNGFYYLAGLFADKDKDFFQVGYEYVQAMNEDIRNIKMPATEYIDLTNPEALSSSLNDRCTELGLIPFPDTLILLLPKAKEIRELYYEYSHIEKRLDKLLDLEYFNNTIIPGYTTPSFNLINYISYYRISNAKIALDYMNGRRLHAIRQLEKNMKTSRFLLARSTSLLQKLAFNATFQINLFLYSDLMDFDPDPMIIKSVLNIAPLTKEELSLEEAFKFEFQFSYRGLERMPSGVCLDRARNISDETMKEFIFFGVKPNLVANINYHRFNALIDISKMSKQDFLKKYNNPGKYYNLKLKDFIRGSLWYVNLTATEPASIQCFLSYILVVQNLDGNIVLLKLKAKIRQEQITKDNIVEFLNDQPEELREPFTGEPVTWKDESEELYLDFPFENIGSNRSLHVLFN